MKNFQYLLESGGAVVVVDGAWDTDEILALVEERGASLVGAAYTHAHADHVGGKMAGKQVWGAAHLRAAAAESGKPLPLWIGAGEVKGAARETGIARGEWTLMKDGDVLELGAIDPEVVRITAVDTPGHSAGGVTLFVSGSGVDPAGPCGGGLVLTGDTLFVGATGRTDLPGASFAKLMKSLSRLSGMPAEAVVLPGHDYGPRPRSTIRDELASNGYMQRALQEYPRHTSAPPLPPVARAPQEGEL